MASAYEVDASLRRATTMGRKLCATCALIDVGLEPLRRDCECRGTDAGFLHLSCLTNYAATKSERAHIMNDNGIGFSSTWVVCGMR